MKSRAGQLPARLFHFVPTASPRNSDLRAVTQLPIKHFMSPSGRRAPPRFDFQIAKDYDPFSIRSSEANIVILDAPGVSPPGAFLFVRGSCGLVLIRLLYVNFGSAPLLAETALATGAPPTGGILPVWGRNGGEDSVWKGRPQAMSGV